MGRVSETSCTHIEEAVQEDRLSQLGETQEADALVTPHLTVHDTGQASKKGQPVIRFGARGVESQGGMVVHTLP